MFRQVAALVLLLPVVALAGDEPPLEDLVRACLEAGDPAARMERALAVVTREPDAGKVAAAVGRAWRFDPEAPKGEPVTWTRTTADGKSHTIFALAPEAYTPEKAWPLLVWLHGGVGRPADGGGRSGVQLFADEAREKGFLVLSPSTEDGAEWWVPEGVALVRGALADMTRRYHVDADRIAVAGFSDGGSACFHLLLHDPGPYACFLAFAGNPLVSRLMGGPTWSTNLSSRPVFAVNGANDQLYPADAMRPLMEELRTVGCALTWVADPDAGHEISALTKHWEEAYAFWQEHPRTALPAEVRWATSVPAREGRLCWVEILEVAAEAPAAPSLEAPQELQVDVPKRPRLGIRLDTAYEGPGLRILEVEEGTPAADAGLEAGDVLVRVGEQALEGAESLQTLRAYLDGLGEEDGLFVVRRGEEELEVRTRPRVLARDAPGRPAALGYDLPVGVVRGRVVASDRIVLETRGVLRLRVYLADPAIDFSKPLTLEVNGVARSAAPAPQDAATVLAQAALLGPGQPLYRGFVDVTVPPAK